MEAPQGVEPTRTNRSTASVLWVSEISLTPSTWLAVYGLESSFSAESPVSQARGKRLFPSRTEKLRPSAAMVAWASACARVARCRGPRTEGCRTNREARPAPDVVRGGRATRSNRTGLLSCHKLRFPGGPEPVASFGRSGSGLARNRPATGSRRRPTECPRCRAGMSPFWLMAVYFKIARTAFPRRAERGSGVAGQK